MRVTNIDKFRNELYGAIETVHFTSRLDKVSFEWDLESINVLALYNVLKIKDNTTREIYIDVDENGVNFWEAKDGYFELITFKPYRGYYSRLVYFMEIAETIDKVVNDII